MGGGVAFPWKVITSEEQMSWRIKSGKYSFFLFVLFHFVNINQFIKMCTMNTNILKIIFTYSFILSNSVFRYWPLVSSHSAAKDSAKVPLKTIAVFLLHFPHKLLLILVLNVSSKTNVIVLVKPQLENCLKSVMHRRFHVQWRRIYMLYG